MPALTNKPKRRRRQKNGNPDVIMIPFRVEEIKGLVLEKLGSRNKGGRPRKQP